jgi:hypothetical protein
VPVVIPATEGESPFTVKDRLTIVQAALIYAGRHPMSVFLSDGSLDDVEVFIGRKGSSDSARGRRLRGAERRWAGARRLSWDIYCTLNRMVERGKIEPARQSFEGGRLDPRRTTIRTADLVKLAERRGERPEYLAEFFGAPAEEIGDEPRGESVDAPRAKTPTGGKPKKRAQSKREPVKQLLAKRYPDGIPGQSKLSNDALYADVEAAWRAAHGARPVPSHDTILRAAGRRNRR